MDIRLKVSTKIDGPNFGCFANFHVRAWHYRVESLVWIIFWMGILELLCPIYSQYVNVYGIKSDFPLLESSLKSGIASNNIRHYRTEEQGMDDLLLKNAKMLIFLVKYFQVSSNSLKIFSKYVRNIFPFCHNQKVLINPEWWIKEASENHFIL